MPDAHIAVDMTPLEPDGQNGGAGIVATELVHHLSSLAPEFRFTLLTSSASHAELAPLDASNVERVCVARPQSSPSAPRVLVDSLLPARARVRLKNAYRAMKTSGRYAHAMEGLRPDLLFNPFTVPNFWRPGVRSVSIVYDLQHLSYPEFFSAEQRLNRQRHVQEACARSERVVCISEFVRRTLLENIEGCAERAVTIPLGLLHEARQSDSTIIDRLGLAGVDFLLYPANFWPHKNHAALFEALRRCHHQNLRLVCTGAPNALMHTLKSQAPPGRVMFAGYLPREQLAGLFDACQALIFPSLYEGFGMPVLEAMARGKPVLCSNVTSLPEVAGDAAIFFDPSDPSQIAAAIDRLFEDQSTVAELVQRGFRRARALGSGREMAARYLALLEQVLASTVA